MPKNDFSSRYARKEDMIAHLQDKIEGLRWELARMIWEESEKGVQLYVIAEEIGKSRGHVGLMRKCWERAGNCPDDMKFNAWYNKMKRVGK